MKEQVKIDALAQTMLDAGNGMNSAILVCACLSVIECITEHDNSTAAFRKQSAELVEGQAFRIRASMRMQEVNEPTKESEK